MSAWPQVTYSYDGTFAGFLTCVLESFAAREYPFYFYPPGEEQYSFYPLRVIETNEEKALRVYRGLKIKCSLGLRQLVEHSFLTCLKQKERHIYDFIYANIYAGPITDLTDHRFLILSGAVRHLLGEAEQYRGFVRFSDHAGVLIGEITPKNRVLPLLRPHFCGRFSQEAFLLYDKTHKEALCYAGGVWKIVPLDCLTLQAPDEEEKAFRSLWRRFYDTIAIEARQNPKLRMSHMPKRFWGDMTEFQDG
ncbi:MAG: metabolism protein [Firmicutes bacterium]|nr:metabolism protein [Bacillota bacterium]